MLRVLALHAKTLSSVLTLENKVKETVCDFYMALCFCGCFVGVGNIFLVLVALIFKQIGDKA